MLLYTSDRGKEQKKNNKIIVSQQIKKKINFHNVILNVSSLSINKFLFLFPRLTIRSHIKFH